MSLRRTGELLRAAGLVPRALAAWAGTDRLAALPPRLPALRAREPVPAAAALALFVAGAELAIDRCRALPLDALLAAELLARGEGGAATVRAPVAVLPLGRGLLVCDRADAPDAPDLVCWPDDSSYHLAGALPPGRRARWVDLGCGSAFAAIARPDAAARLTGIDLNPRAVLHARTGLALSGIDHAEVAVGDAGDAGDAGGVDHGEVDLVTCNAPIPGDPHAAIWRRADAGFLARLAAAIPARLAAGGLAIVHTAREALPAELPGERVFVAYAPGPPAFGVLWWRPDAPPRAVSAYRELTAARPHIGASDRDDALAGVMTTATSST
jgi:SAM-dependent methyltransferase